MALGSLEDSLIAKLKLNELQMPDKITALINYFDAVITGKVKTNPVELKAVLNLMNNYKEQDPDGKFLNYINSHKVTIDYFFSDNMQRFDRFEFKPYFMRLKGIEPGQEYALPLSARRNFETFRPLDTRAYKNILEQNPRDTEELKNRLDKLDSFTAEDRRIAESKKITEAFNTISQKVKQEMQTGKQTKETVLAKLKFVEELFISELQIRYNEPALVKLSELLLAGAEQEQVEEIFGSLKLSQKQRELFCEALAKKI